MKPRAFLIILVLPILFISCSNQVKLEPQQSVSFADSIAYYGDLALSLYNSDKLDESREMYLKLLEFDNPDSLRLTDVILRKRLFFVADTFKAPENLIREGFVLKPLRAVHAELDYKAVMSSEDHLTGVLGRADWPGDLTLEENRGAMEGHEWEFKNRVGFVYTVMNKPETEVIGCVYIQPSRLDDYHAEVILWVTEKEFNQGTDEALYHAVDEWMDKRWPFERIIYPGREISWGDFFETLDQQDKKYIT